MTLLCYALVAFPGSAPPPRMSFACRKPKARPCRSASRLADLAKCSGVRGKSLGASSVNVTERLLPAQPPFFRSKNALLKSATNSKYIPRYILQIQSWGRVNKTSQSSLLVLRSLCSAVGYAAQNRIPNGLFTACCTREGVFSPKTGGS